MTDAQAVQEILARFGPLSDYGIHHAAKAMGRKMTPSSARSRRNELVKAGIVFDSGLRERSDTGYSAKVWMVQK